jgi:anthranilate synthase/aminodeoxychorismate synthase-like glutamine amidotransferase
MSQQRILLIDNYDSFTYNLYDYIVQCGATCLVVRNDATDLIDILYQNWDGVVLSPGPKTPKEAGKLIQCIEILIILKIPMLGICLGHQALGEYFGASLVHAPQPRHGKTSFLEHHQKGIFKGIAQNTVIMRYHSLVLENIGNTPFVITAHSTDDNCVMAIEHTELPIVGIQFHPESILTADGLKMIENWLTGLFPLG